jgi:hypothetical protein
VHAAEVATARVQPRQQQCLRGHGDALVCDPTFPSQAVVCKNGSPAVPPATAFCADLAQTCKRTSAADPTALLQDGVIVCE